MFVFLVVTFFRVRDSFAFKCHRTDLNAFAVNAIAFHPVQGTLVTAGGDGSYQIWDKDSKQRLKSALNLGGPVTACSFSKHSDILVYSIGYDWSKVRLVNGGVFAHFLMFLGI